MEFLKNRCQLIMAVFKELPAVLCRWLQPRRAARQRFELERLDRIRNPSKYLGK